LTYGITHIFLVVPVTWGVRYRITYNVDTREFLPDPTVNKFTASSRTCSDLGGL